MAIGAYLLCVIAQLHDSAATWVTNVANVLGECSFASLGELLHATLEDESVTNPYYKSHANRCGELVAMLSMYAKCLAMNHDEYNARNVKK